MNIRTGAPDHNETLPHPNRRSSTTIQQIIPHRKNQVSERPETHSAAWRQAGPFRSIIARESIHTTRFLLSPSMGNTSPGMMRWESERRVVAQRLRFVPRCAINSGPTCWVRITWFCLAAAFEFNKVRHGRRSSNNIHFVSVP